MRTLTGPARILAVAGLLVLAMAPITGATAHAAQKPVRVTLKGYAFLPRHISVRRGQTIVWTNHDPATHTVTADASSRLHFHSGDLRNHSTFRLTVTKTGIFKYHCAYHSFMQGTITVTAR